jgi:hypothetical protein
MGYLLPKPPRFGGAVDAAIMFFAETKTISEIRISCYEAFSARLDIRTP